MSRRNHMLFASFSRGCSKNISLSIFFFVLLLQVLREIRKFLHLLLDLTASLVCTVHPLFPSFAEFFVSKKRSSKSLIESQTRCPDCTDYQPEFHDSRFQVSRIPVVLVNPWGWSRVELHGGLDRAQVLLIKLLKFQICELIYHFNVPLKVLFELRRKRRDSHREQS